MSDRLDRIEALLEAHGNAMADLSTRQEVTQTQIEGLTSRIDSIASLVSDTRLTALYLLQTIENHEDRIRKIERD
jgi:chromosome segregation ATPase